MRSARYRAGLDFLLNRADRAFDLFKGESELQRGSELGADRETSHMHTPTHHHAIVYHHTTVVRLLSFIRFHMGRLSYSERTLAELAMETVSASFSPLCRRTGDAAPGLLAVDMVDAGLGLAIAAADAPGAPAKCRSERSTRCRQSSSGEQ
jgi:hypothetical protein